MKNLVAALASVLVLVSPVRAQITNGERLSFLYMVHTSTELCVAHGIGPAPQEVEQIKRLTQEETDRASPEEAQRLWAEESTNADLLSKLSGEPIANLCQGIVNTVRTILAPAHKPPPSSNPFLK